MQNWKRFLYLLAVAVFGLAGVARAEVLSVVFLQEKYSLEEKWGNESLWRNEYTVDVPDPAFQRRVRVWEITQDGLSAQEAAQYILRMAAPQGRFSTWDLNENEVMLTFFGGEPGDNRAPYVTPAFNAWKIVKSKCGAVAVGFVFAAYSTLGDAQEDMRRSIVFARTVQKGQQDWLSDLQHLPVPPVWQ